MALGYPEVIVKLHDSVPNLRPRGARFPFHKVGMWLLAIGLMGLVFFATCIGFEVDDKTTIDVVERAGYTEVKLGGTDRWRCSKELESRTFEAINPNGKRVSGVLCCSIVGCGKGCTIRWAP